MELSTYTTIDGRKARITKLEFDYWGKIIAAEYQDEATGFIHYKVYPNLEFEAAEEDYLCLVQK